MDETKTAQGPAKLATEEDLVKDAIGITDPNLHRRIDNEMSPGMNYSLLVGGVNSYRNTEKHTTDPDSEVP